VHGLSRETGITKFPIRMSIATWTIYVRRYILVRQSSLVAVDFYGASGGVCEVLSVSAVGRGGGSSLTAAALVPLPEADPLTPSALPSPSGSPPGTMIATLLPLRSIWSSLFIFLPFGVISYLRKYQKTRRMRGARILIDQRRRYFFSTTYSTTSSNTILT
jgi:hypothetical protein